MNDIEDRVRDVEVEVYNLRLSVDGIEQILNEINTIIDTAASVIKLVKEVSDDRH